MICPFCNKIPLLKRKNARTCGGPECREKRRQTDRNKPENKKKQKAYLREYFLQPGKKEKQKAYLKAYYSAPENKERLKEYKKQYRERPGVREREREYQRQYYRNQQKNKKSKLSLNC